MDSTKVTETLERQDWLEPVAEGLQSAVGAAYGAGGPACKKVENFLNGVWLGHPLHPAVIVLPIGFWTSTLVFDLAGEERAADLSLGLGLVTAVGAAATGAAQWQDAAHNEKPRRLGALHALLNVLATILYAGSWLLRRNGRREAGIALSSLGYGVASASAWIGGDLAYDLGIGVDHTAFAAPPGEWTDVLAEADLPAETPKRVEAGEVPVLLYRKGEEVFAIAATCTHLGGPLDEGKIEGETVTCPWHGSVFCLRDGKVLHGPATMPEPAFEVRVQDGRIAVRARG